MTYKIGDIFTNDKEYTQRAQFCNENGLYIKDLGNGTYQICEPEKPTNDELALQELEQEQTSLEAQIAELKDNLLTATLVNDTEQIESIKAQYQTLVGGE